MKQSIRATMLVISLLISPILKSSDDNYLYKKFIAASSIYLLISGGIKNIIVVPTGNAYDQIIWDSYKTVEDKKEEKNLFTNNFLSYSNENFVSKKQFYGKNNKIIQQPLARKYN